MHARFPPVQRHRTSFTLIVAALLLIVSPSMHTSVLAITNTDCRGIDESSSEVLVVPRDGNVTLMSDTDGAGGAAWTGETKTCVWLVQCPNPSVQAVELYRVDATIDGDYPLQLDALNSAGDSPNSSTLESWNGQVISSDCLSRSYCHTVNKRLVLPTGFFRLAYTAVQGYKGGISFVITCMTTQCPNISIPALPGAYYPHAVKIESPSRPLPEGGHCRATLQCPQNHDIGVRSLTGRVYVDRLKFYDNEQPVNDPLVLWNPQEGTTRTCLSDHDCSLRQGVTLRTTRALLVLSRAPTARDGFQLIYDCIPHSCNISTRTTLPNGEEQTLLISDPDGRGSVHRPLIGQRCSHTVTCPPDRSVAVRRLFAEVRMGVVALFDTSIIPPTLNNWSSPMKSLVNIFSQPSKACLAEDWCDLDHALMYDTTSLTFRFEDKIEYAERRYGFSVLFACVARRCQQSSNELDVSHRIDSSTPPIQRQFWSDEDGYGPSGSHNQTMLDEFCDAWITCPSTHAVVSTDIYAQTEQRTIEFVDPVNASVTLRDAVASEYPFRSCLVEQQCNPRGDHYQFDQSAVRLRYRGKGYRYGWSLKTHCRCRQCPSFFGATSGRVQSDTDGYGAAVMNWNHEACSRTITCPNDMVVGITHYSGQTGFSDQIRLWHPVTKELVWIPVEQVMSSRSCLVEGVCEVTKVAKMLGENSIRFVFQATQAERRGWEANYSCYHSRCGLNMTTTDVGGGQRMVVYLGMNGTVLAGSPHTGEPPLEHTTCDQLIVCPSPLHHMSITTNGEDNFYPWYGFVIYNWSIPSPPNKKNVSSTSAPSQQPRLFYLGESGTYAGYSSCRDSKCQPVLNNRIFKTSVIRLILTLPYTWSRGKVEWTCVCPQGISHCPSANDTTTRRMINDTTPLEASIFGGPRGEIPTRLEPCADEPPTNTSTLSSSVTESTSLNLSPTISLELPPPPSSVNAGESTTTPLGSHSSATPMPSPSSANGTIPNWTLTPAAGGIPPPLVLDVTSTRTIINSDDTVTVAPNGSSNGGNSTLAPYHNSSTAAAEDEASVPLSAAESAVVGTSTVAVLASTSFAGDPSGAQDLQTLMVLSSFLCLGSGANAASSGAMGGVVPFALWPTNGGAAAALLLIMFVSIALNFLSGKIVQLLFPVRFPTFSAAMERVRCPSIANYVLVLGYQGLTLTGFLALFGEGETSVDRLVGAVSLVVSIALPVYPMFMIYRKAAGWAVPPFDPYNKALNHFPSLLRTSILPSGHWNYSSTPSDVPQHGEAVATPANLVKQQRHDYRCYGGFFAKVRGARLFWYLPANQIKAFATALIVSVKTGAPCSVLLGALAALQLLGALIILVFSPYRAGIRNVSTIIMSLAAASLPISALAAKQLPVIGRYATLIAAIVSCIAAVLQFVVAWRDEKWRKEERENCCGGVTSPMDRSHNRESTGQEEAELGQALLTVQEVSNPLAKKK